MSVRGPGAAQVDAWVDWQDFLRAPTGVDPLLDPHMPPAEQQAKLAVKQFGVRTERQKYILFEDARCVSQAHALHLAAGPVSLRKRRSRYVLSGPLCVLLKSEGRCQSTNPWVLSIPVTHGSPAVQCAKRRRTRGLDATSYRKAAPLSH